MDPLKITLEREWPFGASLRTRTHIARIVAWEVEHEADWYPRPGRTLYVADEDSGSTIKVKGAGFYNPGNVSFSGLKRTTTHIPEHPQPMRPLEMAFKRDLIHVDPSIDPPHLMQSVQSNYAPVGGMTLDAAENDQRMFARLNAAALCANRPLATFEYAEMRLDGTRMGVSISELPPNSLPITPYEIYLAWYEAVTDPKSIAFLEGYAEERPFSISNPSHRLQVLSKISRIAGRLILHFSTRAGLYRFSGSPDNWNMRIDTESPLFFSDVDTSRTLESIMAPQWGWEVLRNLLSAIHQWVYYFIPCLTYEESGYSLEMVRSKSHDFINGLLSGFFEGSGTDMIESATDRIWRFLEPALSGLSRTMRLPLRSGERFLQTHLPRPVFYFGVLTLLTGLIQDSEVQKAFTRTDTAPEGIRDYVNSSAAHPSHPEMFAGFAALKMQNRMALASG